MTCPQMQNLLHAYLDGELDLVRTLEFEHHVADCTACGELLEAQQSLRASIASAPLYQRAPGSLKERVLGALGPSAPQPVPAASKRPQRFRVAIAASVGLFALGLLGTIGLILGRAPSAGDRLAQEAIASHVRSLQVAHLTDIASGDGHEVKPWFEGKLDFSPAVIDLKDKGYPLVGGRLDYLNERPVAALVYQRRKHAINVFIWPEARPGDSEFRSIERQGYHLVRWSEGEMRYCAVSNLNPAELKQFGELLRGELAGR